MCKNVRLIDLEIDRTIRAGCLPVEPNDLEKLTGTYPLHDRIASIVERVCQTENPALWSVDR